MLRLWLMVLVLVAALTTDEARAGQETLDSLIATALANNPGFKAANFNARSSEYSAKAAGTLPDPNFSVGLMNMPRSSLALNETPMSGVSLGVSQMIPWPGKLRARSHWADLGQKRDEMDARTIRNRLVHNVTSAYYDYSYWSLGTEIIKESIALINATTRVTEERYSQGDATAHDVLTAQTSGSRLEIRLLKAEQMRKSALLELWRTVKDSSAIANLPPFLPDPSNGQGTGQALAANPVLRDAELAVEQARVGRSLAKSEYWPDIMVGADYLLRQTPADRSMDGENWLSIHVGVSLPLWFFSKQKNEVRASEQMVLATRERAQEVRDMVEREIEDARLNLTVLEQSLRSYDTAILPQARAGYEAAEIAYEVAKIDFDALLSTQMQLLDIELERLDLVYRINQTEAQLVELLGNNNERQ